MIQFHFDMMNQPGAATPARLYAEALDIVEYLDQRIDLHAAVLSEHHMATYMTDPIPFGYAVAARTRHCRVRIQSAVAANYDPVRLAEQTALLDIVSNGRSDLTLAWGYDPAERDMYPRELPAAQLMPRLIELLRTAWRGEPFTWGERKGQLKQLPVQDPIRIFIAGMAEPAVRRAAQLGDGFMPMMNESVPQYLQYCEEYGRTPGEICQPPPYKYFHVSEDPAAAWEKIRPHAQHDLDTYWQWMAHFGVPQQFAPATWEECQASSDYMIFTPEQAIDYLRNSNIFYTKPLLGGLDPAVAWESIRLLAEQVFPAVDDNAPGTTAAQYLPADYPLTR